MNDKGLDLLDQKDLIIEQAKQQYDKGEINQHQFDVSIQVITCSTSFLARGVKNLQAGEKSYLIAHV